MDELDAPDAPESMPSFAIGLITAGNIRIEYAVSLWLSRESFDFDWLAQSSGPYLDVGRNRIVEGFYTHDERRADTGLPRYRGLLMTDSDVAWTPEDIQRLIDAEDTYYATHGVRPIVGGCYLGSGSDGQFPVTYRFDDPDNPGAATMRHLALTDITDSPTTLIPLDGIGTGFMWIHRDILDHFREFYEPPAVWFSDLIVDGGWFGEDLMFCMRGAAIGHPTFAHSDVRLTHYKDIGLVFPSDPDTTPDPYTLGR